MKRSARKSKSTKPAETEHPLHHRPLGVALGAYRAEVRRQAQDTRPPNQEEAEALLDRVADVAAELANLFEIAKPETFKTVCSVMYRLNPELMVLLKVCASKNCTEPIPATRTDRSTCAQCRKELN